MRCAWQEYLSLLPPWMRQTVDRLGRDTLQELRLRLNEPPELITACGSFFLEANATTEDLRYVVNVASHYSPWAAETITRGYLTAPGGHRIGICGEASMAQEQIKWIRQPASLCLRVARDFPGIADNAAKLSGSILILGRPGSGKTTLLRDLIRQRSNRGPGSIGVVDERGELFPAAFPKGKRTDVLTGCRKDVGIDMILRTMGPETIAVDEITAESDCKALQQALWCGVRLLATAHAGGRDDLLARPVYRPIVGSKLFETLLILQPDKSWRTERMVL